MRPGRRRCTVPFVLLLVGVVIVIIVVAAAVFFGMVGAVSAGPKPSEGEETAGQGYQKPR